MNSKLPRVRLRKARPFVDPFVDGWRIGRFIGTILGTVVAWLRLVLFPPTRIVSIPKGQDERETATLLREVRELWDGSLLGEVDPSTIVAELVSRVCTEADLTPSPAVLDILADTVTALMVDEGIWEVPTVGGDLSLEEGAQVRSYLRAQRRFLIHFDEHFDLWALHVTATLGAVLKALPESLIEVEDEEGGQRLQAYLIDMAHAPAQLIQDLAFSFSTDELIEAKLFEDLRQRIYFNTLEVSGIDPDKVDSTSKKAILPTQVRGSSPTRLVSDYLGGTPYQRFLKTRMGFGVPSETRFEHTHILGGTGHGKTQLLKLLAYEDIRASIEDGRSVIVLDSQGDLVATLAHLKEFAPGSPLADRMLLVDPTDTDFPVCLNLFAMRGERPDLSGAEREQLFNATVALYEYMFGALLGAELTQRHGVIFRYLARLMMVIPNATVHTFRELMHDARPYREYVERLDGTARAFFETQFFSKSFDPTKKQILTRLWGVLANQTFDRMFSHTENRVDLFEAMNSGKIVLINTAKDLLQKDGCSIFGRFFIALITQAALTRAAIPTEKRRPCFVYVDEAHEYFDEHTEDLLNQARKYRVGMVLAHQNLDQLGIKLRATVMASTSIKLAGGVSSKDAIALAREMNGDPDFIGSARKRKNQTEFACFVRNLTPSPITVTVPLGAVDRKPQLTDNEYAELLSTNRRRVALPLTDSLRHLESHGAPAEEVITDARAPAVSSPPAHAVRDASPAAPQRDPKRPVLEGKLPPPPPAPLGRGGKQHKYLQGLIKQIAEAHGFRATIEDSVGDGAGSVDVSLAKDDLLIACEISVTTSPGHELRNVEKCIAAGYGKVVVISPDRRNLTKLRTAVEAGLDESDSARVAFLLPDECPTFLAELSPSTPAAQTVRGYKVKLNYRALGDTEQQRRRAAIGKVIAGSMKRLG